MANGGNAWPWHWRRFIVDVLIGASAGTVALAAIGTTADVPYMLLIWGASALVGIGLMLEPNVTAQSAGDIGPRSLRPPTQSNLRDSGSGQWADGFDAGIVEATSP
jgi:hypothetical protein